MTFREFLAVVVCAVAHDRRLVAEAYCESPTCAVREVTIRLKDHDETLVPMLERRGVLDCPVCGQPLKPHWVMDAAAHHDRAKRRARQSANTQMYERNGGASANRLVLVPASVLLRDELPPTPPGWWTPATSGQNGRTEDVA